MIIIPAIDIKDGKCVRLFQGDFSKQTTYSDDPLYIAVKWQNSGAKLIHVVDLDGARIGVPINFEIISAIAKKIPVQVGGGIRDIKTIQKYIDAGVQRVVLGTALLEDFEFAKKVFEKFKEQIVIGLDAKNGIVMTRGWISDSDLEIMDAAQKLKELGAKRIIYTDILKDGSLTQPNYESLKEIIQLTKIPVIASGGISEASQIKELQVIGAEGVIIGKALYEGKIDLEEVLNAR